MATPVRYFQKDAYYHVYNRGNRKQAIFLQERDYQRFLAKIREYKELFGINILSYCLMPNHFHFLVQQTSDTPITMFMLRLGTSYSKYFNLKYTQVGSLFQGRFQAKLIESDEYLLHLSRYIHRNPVNLLGENQKLSSYIWSSYGSYLGESVDPIANSLPVLSYFSSNYQLADYKTFVEFDFQPNSLPETLTVPFE
jgi:putative transposase